MYDGRLDRFVDSGEEYFASDRLAYLHLKRPLRASQTFDNSWIQFDVFMYQHAVSALARYEKSEVLRSGRHGCF